MRSNQTCFNFEIGVLRHSSPRAGVEGRTCVGKGGGSEQPPNEWGIGFDDVPEVVNNIIRIGRSLRHLGPTSNASNGASALARGTITKLVRPEGCVLPHRKK